MRSNRFIITVIGVDKVGIVANTTKIMADFSVNIVDISQTIMEDLFTMIMLVEVNDEHFNLSAFQQAMKEGGEAIGVEVTVHQEDAFRFMHRI
ncbi:MAG: ACT domain-containing protein [Methanosarcinaceae archaeon]|nr:ACT domain-containing protein [Methanosarcinaceae archaeon]